MKEEYLKDEMKAIDMAIEFENKIRNFYLKEAEDMENSLAKKTFLYLAEQELRHADSIRSFNESILKDREPIIERPDHKIALVKAKEFFLKAVDDTSKEEDVDKEDLKAYTIASKIEKEGYEFYKESHAKAEHENLKKLFSFLMDEEISHHALIDKAIAFLEDPIGWHAKEEEWMFEG